MDDDDDDDEGMMMAMKMIRTYFRLLLLYLWFQRIRYPSVCSSSPLSIIHSIRWVYVDQSIGR